MAFVGKNDASSPGIERGPGWLARWWRRHRALDELWHLTDPQLRDIGIERRDIDTLVYCHVNRFRPWSARF
jgi:uncharacterized protein YjiS (DUF1127 family)